MVQSTCFDLGILRIKGLLDLGVFSDSGPGDPYVVDLVILGVNSMNLCLLSRETLPDVKDAFAIVSREESHRGLDSSSSGFMTKPQVSSFVAKSNNWSNNGNKKADNNKSKQGTKEEVEENEDADMEEDDDAEII
nr:ribonuclease H-like domain-containing protein [Tanacetum cinerariifolium]